MSLLMLFGEEEFELLVVLVFGGMNFELFFRVRVVRLNLFFFWFNDEFLNDLILNNEVSLFW